MRRNGRTGEGEQKPPAEPPSSRWAELLSLIDTPQQLFAQLSRDIGERVSCEAVGIVRIGTMRATMLEGWKLPAGLVGWSGPAARADEALAHRILWAAKNEYRDAHLFALRRRQHDIGAIVLLSSRASVLATEDRRWVAELSTVAATCLALTASDDDSARTQEESTQVNEALKRAEPQRAVGAMTLGIAHDVRNLLYPLSLHLQVLSGLVATEPGEVRETITEMSLAISQTVALLNRLRWFGREPVLDTNSRIEDPSLWVGEAIRLAQMRAHAQPSGSAVALEALLSPVPAIRGTPSELVSAVVNLLFNAIDAMTRGGTVRVRIGCDGPGVFVRIADGGPGIPRELQGRVFEPFFTTNPETGTGLGLASVKGTVERWGGRVELESVPGAGAAFTLWFPVISSSAVFKTPEVPAFRPAGVAEREGHVISESCLHVQRRGAAEHPAAKRARSNG